MNPLRTPVASSSNVRKTVSSPGASSIRYMPHPRCKEVDPAEDANFVLTRGAFRCMTGWHTPEIALPVGEPHVPWLRHHNRRAPMELSGEAPDGDEGRTRP